MGAGGGAGVGKIGPGGHVEFDYDAHGASLPFVPSAPAFEVTPRLLRIRDLLAQDPRRRVPRFLEAQDAVAAYCDAAGHVILRNAQVSRYIRK